MKFEKFFVIGSGRVAKKCCEIAANFFNQSVEILNFENSEKADIFFANLSNSLIISANNFYIFKSQAIKRNTIINYHNSLLPRHKGVNAHIWAIYDNDKESGVTWHLVDEGIDTGKIIIQEKIKLDNKMNSGELLIQQHKLAIDIFEKCLENLLNSKFIENSKENLKTHKRDELPNNGLVDITMSKSKISAILRAMNTGAFREIPYPKIVVFGNLEQIVFYEIKENLLSIHLSNNKEILIKTKENL